MEDANGVEAISSVPTAWWTFGRMCRWRLAHTSPATGKGRSKAWASAHDAAQVEVYVSSPAARTMPIAAGKHRHDTGFGCL
jgi:hypothetical protein